MNLYQISTLIDSKIEEFENKAKQITNVHILNEIFQYISFLKVIKHHIDVQDCETETVNGRKVASVKAYNTSEALAALDILRTEISSEDYQYGKTVEETIYVTNEGVCWGG